MRSLAAFALALALAFALPGRAHAIGYLVPTDGSLEPLRIEQHEVSVDVRERIAETRVQQTFRNTSGRTLEATYVFPVPEGATVSGFAMWVDGRRVEGELLDATTARSVYEGIVARLRDPGLVEHLGGSLFRARVFPIAPGSAQHIEIRFSETLPYQGSVVHYRYPLHTSGAATATLSTFSLSFDIASRTAIRSVYSPSHNVEVRRESDHRVIASYRGNRTTLDRDFDLYYAVEDGDVGLSLLTHRDRGDDGYFLAMIAPRTDLTDAELASKEVLFVFDTSGSMAGEKIERARTALTTMLARLRPTDRFQVVRFATDVELLFDRGVSEPATPENVARATRFAQRFVPAGGTAIAPALRAALRTAGQRPEAPRMVVFLTDGMPTVGTTDTTQIVREIGTSATDGHARVFAFGVGDDVNTTFLDGLAQATAGSGEYFRDGVELERRLTAFYDRIAYPALTDVHLTMPGASVYDVYPRELHELHRGEQVLVVGRYRGDGPARVVLEGRVGSDPTPRAFAFDVRLADVEPQNEFLPRVWAVRKVGDLLDAIRLGGERAELRDEVVRLARQFGLVTPYTSYLVAPDAPSVAPTNPQSPAQSPVAQNPIDDLLRGAMSGARRRRFEGFDSTVAPSTAAPPAPPRGGSGSASTSATPTPTPSAPMVSGAAPAGATGERGRRISEELRSMREAERADEATSDATRFALGRAFTWDGARFVDAAFQPSMRVLRVRPMSRAAFVILAAHPELRAAFAIGERVVLVVDATRAIELTPDAPDQTEDAARSFFE